MYADNPHVLIVEDDTNLRRLYTKVLTKAGYLVSEAEDITDGRELLLRQRFDVFICDMRLVSGDGITLIREQYGRLMMVGTQVVVVSAQEHYRSMCEDIGVEFFLSKPVSTHELVNLVNRLTGTIPPPRGHSPGSYTYV